MTLTGTGGIGKTRLGLELVRRLSPEFQHGSAVATIANLRDPALVAGAILEALEVPEVGPNPEEELIRALASSELLLLVDNFEQVITAAPSIARLLAAAPRVKVIVTSRAPLRVAAEREVPVPPLADDEAAELFIARAQAADPAFALTERTRARLPSSAHASTACLWQSNLRPRGRSSYRLRLCLHGWATGWSCSPADDATRLVINRHSA